MHVNLICLFQGDGFQHHNGMKFTTKDQDNDPWSKNGAVEYKGAWWFYGSMHSNLNGPYHKSAVKSYAIVGWYDFGNIWISLKSARMMVRSKA